MELQRCLRFLEMSGFTDKFQYVEGSDCDEKHIFLESSNKSKEQEKI